MCSIISSTCFIRIDDWTVTLIPVGSDHLLKKKKKQKTLQIDRLVSSTYVHSVLCTLCLCICILYSVYQISVGSLSLYMYTLPLYTLPLYSVLCICILYSVYQISVGSLSLSIDFVILASWMFWGKSKVEGEYTHMRVYITARHGTAW